MTSRTSRLQSDRSGHEICLWIIVLLVLFPGPYFLVASSSVQFDRGAAGLVVRPEVSGSLLGESEVPKNSPEAVSISAATLKPGIKSAACFEPDPISTGFKFHPDLQVVTTTPRSTNDRISQLRETAWSSTATSMCASSVTGLIPSPQPLASENQATKAPTTVRRPTRTSQLTATDDETCHDDDHSEDSGVTISHCESGFWWDGISNEDDASSQIFTETIKLSKSRELHPATAEKGVHEEVAESPSTKVGQLRPQQHLESTTKTIVAETAQRSVPTVLATSEISVLESVERPPANAEVVVSENNSSSNSNPSRMSAANAKPLEGTEIDLQLSNEAATHRHAEARRVPPPSRHAPKNEHDDTSKNSTVSEPPSGGTSQSDSTKQRASRSGNGTTKDEGFNVRKVDKLPIDALLEEKDLSVLGTVLTQAATGTNENMKRIAATVFAPTDAAFKALPIDINDSNEIDFPNRMEYATSIFEYHVVAPRLVPPLLIPLDAKEGMQLATRFKKHSLSIVRTSTPSKLGNFTITVDGYATVVEIVQTKRGWIYKLDAVLAPGWNPGPSLRDYLSQHQSLKKTLFLLDTAQLFTPKTEKMGPITVLAMRNGGWKMNGFELPSCAFTALARPENREFLLSILKWFTVPGMWSYTDIANATTLPNIQPSTLTVTKIVSSMSDFREEHGNGIGQLNTEQISNGTQQATGNSTDSSTARDPSRTTIFRNKDYPTLLIQGQQIVESDIPIHNGWLHILARLPKVDGFSPVVALWDCVHEFCYECPTVAPHVLEFFDEGGLIPSQRPLEYIVPPGSRPEWVCQGSSGWFPPGWKKKKWDRYIQRAKSGSSSAAKEAMAGYSEAAQRIANLRIKLNEANVKLRRIQANVDYTQQHFRPLWDPQSLISFATTRRDFSGMPDCKLKDNPQELTLHDMRYISRWMLNAK